MRPLFLEFPGDEETYSVSDQFMIGESLLAAPVLERGAERRLVYLPYGEGNSTVTWRNWWSDEKLESGYHVVEAPLDIMPMFVREGRGVPYTQAVQTTDIYPNKLRIKICAGKKDEGEVRIPIYHDDGETKRYSDGKYFYGTFVLDVGEETTEPKLEVERDGYQPFWDELEIDK